MHVTRKSHGLGSWLQFEHKTFKLQELIFETHLVNKLNLWRNLLLNFYSGLIQYQRHKNKRNFLALKSVNWIFLIIHDLLSLNMFWVCKGFMNKHTQAGCKIKTISVDLNQDESFSMSKIARGSILLSQLNINYTSNS